MILVGLIGERLSYPLQKDERTLKQRTLDLFTVNWGLKVLALLFAITLVILRHKGIVGNG